MFTLPSLANSSTTLSLPPSVLATATPDLVSTRVTSVGASAPLSDEAVGDNTQSIPVAPVATQSQSDALTAVGGGNLSGTLANNISVSGPSSSFLAQLLSQYNDTEDSTVALASSYTHFAPAPVYNMFVEYGLVKYKPSDAGIPPQRSPLPALATQGNTQPAVTQVVTQPQSQAPAPVTSFVQNTTPTPAENVANVTTFAPPTSSTAVAAAAPTPSVPEFVPVQNQAASVTLPTNASVAVANNFQAYSNTQTRNQTNLAFAVPQIVIAG